MTPIDGWQNFYVIIGSSAGALIGLQFVVITLIADMPVSRDMEQAGAAFATPNVIHFGAALLLAAIMSAPWHSVAGAEMLWGWLGFSGIVYEIIVLRRMRRQNAYAPELEDWLFHAWLPFAAYAILLVTTVESRSHIIASLFAVAGSALLLRFIGIHNAWDAVTYHVFTQKRRQHEAGSRRDDTH